MFRLILRNVQFYLLFFSLLLVLLAFQRLQWYDQGLLPYPNAFIDGSHHDDVTPTSSSYDDSSPQRIFYGGDQLKEIGWFKFRVGLFKFMLPTLKSSQQTQQPYLRTVPLPPNQSKRNRNINVGRSYSRQESGKLKQLKGAQMDHLKKMQAEKEVTGISIAYVAVAPQLSFLLKPENSDLNNTLETCPFYEKASALSESIYRAHNSTTNVLSKDMGFNSSLDFKLYAINFENIPGKIGSATDNLMQQCLNGLLQLGFEVVNIDWQDLDHEMNRGTNSKIMAKNLPVRFLEQKLTSKNKGIHEVLDRHDIVVKVDMNSVLLAPLNDFFEILISDGLRNDTSSVELSQQRRNSGDGSNEGHTSMYLLKKLSVGEPTFDTATPIVNGEDLFIFKSNHSEAGRFFLEKLKCTPLQWKQKQVSSRKLDRELISKKNELDSYEQLCATSFDNSNLALQRCEHLEEKIGLMYYCSELEIKTAGGDKT